ncbi:MAG TPA: MJ0042-type zinc finger domain-containing protein [Polyangia bacterium]|jgi:predicted Zn finger-like uncharacterized protein
MGRKRPERTARRRAERGARELVRDREKLAALDIGGSPERPIEVSSSAVIEGRARAQRCPQCGGSYRIEDHQAPSATLREVAVRCAQCGVGRRLWFRITVAAPS